MKLHLLVIRTANPTELKEQYEQLGFEFDYHQHGKGPFHYASEHQGFVFEIYPLTKSMDKADASTRLGFEIENVDATIKKIENSNWKIISQPKNTEWGTMAIVQDLDGRKVELKHA
jgi:hypothetical protein